MFDESNYQFTRYLSSKKSVDDRSLNRVVWEKLRSLIALEHSSNPMTVLEIGAGIGTMFERALEWELLVKANYTAIDAMKENIEEAKARVPGWAYNVGYSVEQIADNELKLSGLGREVKLKLDEADFFEFARRNDVTSRWDVIIANAFLDLVDAGRTLPITLDLLKPKGLLYFTINFDGSTVLEPEIDPEFDAFIEDLYHRTMDDRVIDGAISGDSRTGRHFFKIARENGVEILESGSSDWTVFAGKAGYREDEAYFLHFIIHTMYMALKNSPGLDIHKFKNWIEERHSQIENGKLVYIAHQLDFLCRKEPLRK
ncbi:MAG: class I SAM-dependent methyltransferase [Deltaproteobacteria bacterium]|nr:class I SAM-dependent methyltransferase [Deltaproteobacteria bacterium]